MLRPFPLPIHTTIALPIIANTPIPNCPNLFSSPCLPCSNAFPIAPVIPVKILVAIIIEIPLPLPRSVINSPSHIKKIVPATTLNTAEIKKEVDISHKVEDELEVEAVEAAPNVAKISGVGTAMRTQPGVAKTMFETLASKGVNMHVISTSEIKISVLIDSEYTELAVRSLHTAYGLDDDS